MTLRTWVQRFWPLLLVAGVVFVVLWPLPSRVLHPVPPEPLTVEDRTGKVLYVSQKSDEGSHTWVPLREIPALLQEAVILTEDRTFRSNIGISFRGIGRAIFKNLQNGKVVEGGSTITQQYVRILLGTKKQTLFTKLREALDAVKLERIRSKDEILEGYLNTAYFGRRAEGIGAAAHAYFGKSVQELGLAEIAYLTGLLQSPSVYADSPKAAKDRQKVILQILSDQHIITEQEAHDAGALTLDFQKPTHDMQAPHFVQWVLQERSDDLPDRGAVRTTLDLDLQKRVESIVNEEVSALSQKNVTSAAVVVLDAHTGEILSMVGSRDYFDDAHDGQVNVAISARQPGSALKPFTYALALSHGDTAATTIADTFVQLFTQEGNPYTPRNYDFGEHGLVRYREALANSYNIAAVKVLETLGVEKLLSFLQSAGITTLTELPEHYGLALTLGAGEVRLLELAKAYGIFPRGGETLPLRSLLGDNEKTLPKTHVLDARVAWIISDILSDNAARVSEFGSENALVFDFPVAAKTGTTRNARDNWTMGYTPDRIVGVWVGNADNSPMKDTSGITGAGPIFHRVMIEAMRDLPKQDFPRPSGITEKEVCRLSGKLPTDLCGGTLTEYFVQGTEPKTPDDIFRSVPIDTRNGFFAGTSCPAEFTQEKVFAYFPLELQAWARDHHWPAPSSGALSPLCGGTAVSSTNASSEIRIESPQQNENFRLNPTVPAANQTIIFKATVSSHPESLTWFVNGEPVGKGHAPDYRIDWPPIEGIFTISAKSGEAESHVHIEVISPVESGGVR